MTLSSDKVVNFLLSHNTLTCEFEMFVDGKPHSFEAQNTGTMRCSADAPTNEQSEPLL